MTIFDLVPLSHWRKHYTWCRYVQYNNLSSEAERHMMNVELLTMLCAKQQARIAELEKVVAEWVFKGVDLKG
jgi:hypothetical protein